MRVVATWKEELRNWIAYQSTPVPVHYVVIGDSDISKDKSVTNIAKMKPQVPSSSSHIFWHGDLLDALSRYSFMETFNVGEFPEQ